MSNAYQLALRDAAQAALVGVELGSDFGADIGDDVHGDFGADFGDDMHGDFGADIGDDVHGDFGAEPTAQQALAMWRKRRARRPTGRKAVLTPNAGSEDKIMRYAFSIAPAVLPVIGVASAINATGNPRVTIRPKRLTINVPCAGLLGLASIDIGNVNALVGGGQMDAFACGANAIGSQFDLPTVTPAYPVTIIGNWSALVPAGYAAAAYPLSFTFFGPAEMVG